MDDRPDQDPMVPSSRAIMDPGLLRFDANKERIGAGHNRYFVVPFGGKTTRFRGPRVITVYPAVPFGGEPSVRGHVPRPYWQETVLRMDPSDILDQAFDSLFWVELWIFMGILGRALETFENVWEPLRLRSAFNTAIIGVFGVIPFYGLNPVNSVGLSTEDRAGRDPVWAGSIPVESGRDTLSLSLCVACDLGEIGRNRREQQGGGGRVESEKGGGACDLGRDGLEARFWRRHRELGSGGEEKVENGNGVAPKPCSHLPFIDRVQRQKRDDLAGYPDCFGAVCRIGYCSSRRIQQDLRAFEQDFRQYSWIQ
ncbi:hypothetical protein KFK09_023933 [Dendrobium nobile]|uniref:Uncharacterized protein n=1 Tax=Dendrobium nobile TaxID=94219 RepID=A0A8T3ACG8_DENNO|nr:hypothetical protein KFK09_023933 [Dendrobium nobile]